MDDRLAALTQALPWFLAQNDCRQRCLVEMAYQMGTAGLLHWTTFLPLVAAGEYQAAHDDLLQQALARETPERAQRYAQMILTGTDPA